MNSETQNYRQKFYYTITKHVKMNAFVLSSCFIQNFQPVLGLKQIYVQKKQKTFSSSFCSTLSFLQGTPFSFCCFLFQWFCNRRRRKPFIYLRFHNSSSSTFLLCSNKFLFIIKNPNYNNDDDDDDDLPLG